MWVNIIDGTGAQMRMVSAHALRFWGTVFFAVSLTVAGWAQEIASKTGQFLFEQQGPIINNQSFVLPLDHQSGVQLAPNAHSPWPENQLSNNLPWVFRTATTTRYLYASAGAPVAQGYSIQATNPIAVFGSLVGGRPMLSGRSYRFAFFAGAQTSATDVADEMVLYVYRKSDFTGSQSVVTPVVTQTIDIPHWPSVAAGGSTAAWQQFGNNGYQTTVATSVSGQTILETTVQLVLASTTDQTWGVSYGAPLLITHKGLSADYCYIVGYKGMISTGANTTTPMAVTNAQSPATSATHVLGYGFQFDVDSPWATTLIKTPSFQGEPAPPAYYGKTADELMALTARFEKQYAAPAGAYGTLSGSPELQAHPILDKLAADLGNDPLAIVNYVTNEIELSDALSYNENGDVDDVSINSGGMNRGALGAYLEGQGSPEEQCALLVYLLRKAGVQSGFVRAPHNQVKMLDQQLSNLLGMRIKGAITPLNFQPVPQFIPVNYPWVAAYVTVDGVQKWVHVFPWLKDVEVVEGLGVEGFLPRNKKTIREWVRDYVLADANHPIMQLDAEDHTPGNLFLKDLDKSLREQWTGISRDDLGIHFRTRKVNRQRLTEFPQPAQFTAENLLPAGTAYQLTANLAPDSSWYDTLDIEIRSTVNTSKKININGVRIMDLHNRRAAVNFKTVAGSNTAYDLVFSMEAFDLNNPGSSTGDFTTGSDPYLRKKQIKTLRVNNNDKQFAFKVTYHRPRAYLPPPLNNTVDPAILGGWSNFLGISHLENGAGAGESSDPVESSRTLISTSYFGLGDLSAFCLNTGRVTQKMLQPHLDKFWAHEQARLAAPGTAPDYELMKGTMAWLLGMNYYQRVSTSFEGLKDLFKVHVVSQRSHGFALLGALQNSQGKLVVANNQIEQVYPKVDMVFFRSTWAGYGDVRPDAGGQGAVGGLDFMNDFAVIEMSALESHTISKYFPEEDTDAVSTVTLIQKLQQDGNSATNVIELNSSNWLSEKGKSYTFNGQTATLEQWAGGGAAGSMWGQVEKLFTAWDKDSGRAYITPGPVTGAKAQWKGMGALIIGRDSSAALIGRLNGGYSAWAPSLTSSASTYTDYFSSPAPFNGGLAAQTFSLGSGGNISLVSSYNFSDYSANSATVFLNSAPQVSSIGSLIGSFGSQSTGSMLANYSNTSQSSLYLGSQTYNSGGLTYGAFTTSSFGSTYSSLENAGSLFLPSSNTSVGASVFTGDPVNTITGELYADEVDLILPGPLPLQVRRNYGSQSLTRGNFGHGWKMAYFPYLFVNEDESKIYAAELDGAVIVYARTTSSSSDWVVKPEDNPNLTNGEGFNVGSVFNRYLNKLSRVTTGGKTTYRLTGGDGSLREYEVRSYPLLGSSVQRTRPYIKRWTDANGNFLDFVFYGDTAGDSSSAPSYGELAKVKASNGNVLGFQYDTFGRIVEVYAQDGRRLYYTYDDEGDLREVRLPDNSWVKYDYLREQGPVGTGTPVRLAWGSTHLLNRETRPDGRIVESDYRLYVAGDTDVSGAVITADKVGKASHLRQVVQQRANVGKHQAGDGRDKPAQESYEPVRNSSYIYTQTKDAQGRITGSTQIKDAYDRITTFHYVNSHLTRTVDTMAMETSQEWFTQADVTASVPGAYENGLKARVDRRGLRTEFKYNSSGDVVEIASIGDLDGDGVVALGEKAVTLIAYTAVHLPELVIRPNMSTGLAAGTRSRYTYGDATRPYMITLVEELAADGTSVITSSSMEYHDVFTVINDLAQPFSKGLLYRSKQAVGTADEAMVEWQHDPRGFPTEKTSATGTTDPVVKTGFTHNLRGELIEERAMDGSTVKKTNRYAYDDSGRRMWEERLDSTGKQVGWNYIYYNLNGDVEWTDGSRSNPEDYSYTRYDGGGRPVEQVSWRSEAKSDGSGVQAVAGVAKYATSFYAYNLFGDLIKTVDPLGNTTKATYDNLGRKLTQAAYQGDWQSGGTALASESFAYGQSGITETYSRHTDVRGGVTEVYYTTSGKPRLQTNPDGSTQEWRYYLDGRLRREPAGGGKYWEYSYDEINRKSVRTLKDFQGAIKGTEESVTDRRGNATAHKDIAGYITTATYDKLDRLKTSTAPADATYPGRSPQLVTTYVYDAAGFQAQASNALGESTVTTLDALGRVVGTVVKNAQDVMVSQSSVAYSSDFHGVTTTAGVGQGAVITQTWTDVDDRTVLVKHADDSYVTSAYDAAGQPVAVRDEIGNITRTEYDALGRVSRTTLPDSAQTNFIYTFPVGGGEQQERLMPGQLAEVVKYNAAGQLVEKYNRGAGGVTARRYQNYSYHITGAKAGFLQSFTDPLAQVHTYIYDESWGRVASYSSGAAGSVGRVDRTYGYDGMGRIDSVTETTGAGVSSVVQQTYAQNGSLLTDKLTLSGSVVRHLENTYDAAGRRVRLARGAEVAAQGVGAGDQQDFAWRADGLLSSVTVDGVAGAFGYTYGTQGLLLNRTNPFRTQTVSATTGRDSRGRLISMQTSVTGVVGTLLQESIQWTVDNRQLNYTAARAAAGGVVSWSDARQYLYTEGRLQLARETYGTGPAGGSQTLNHEYDFAQPGGLGVRTVSVASTAVNGVLWGSFVGDGATGGIDAFGRVSDEYVGSERFHLRAHGRALGAKEVTLKLNGGAASGTTDTSLLPSDPAGNWQSGDWEKWLRLEPGSYTLTAEALHPSGQKANSASVDFTVQGGSLPVVVSHDAAGQVWKRVIAGGHREQTLTWDAEGRLIKVVQIEPLLSGIGWQWEAVYDGFNRRVRTLSTPLITKATGLAEPDLSKRTREDMWYDPLVEFMEVAVEINGERQWAVHGPDLGGSYGGMEGMGGLEAWVTERSGVATGMVDDAYGHVVGSVTAGVFSWQATRAVGYGPQPGAPVYRVAEGASLARATGWRGKRQDITGFYYMGARDYDPQSTRFLSTDPMGHAASMSLYDYANGDPINFVDPRGRSAIKPGYGNIISSEIQQSYNNDAMGAWQGQETIRIRNDEFWNNSIAGQALRMVPGFNLLAAYETGGADAVFMEVMIGMIMAPLGVIGNSSRIGVQVVSGMARSGVARAGASAFVRAEARALVKAEAGALVKAEARQAAGSGLAGKAAEKLPRGFTSSEQFSQAGRELSDALKKSGIEVSQTGVRGSSVTGVSSKGGAFREVPTDNLKASDIDAFVELISPMNVRTSSKIPGFIHPDKLMKRYPALQEWSEKWTKLLGREITPAGFQPGTFTDTAIKKF